MTRVVKEIARLAGQDDFEPVFAGRKWKPTEAEVRTDFEDRNRRHAAQGKRAPSG